MQQESGPAYQVCDLTRAVESLHAGRERQAAHCCRCQVDDTETWHMVCGEAAAGAVCGRLLHT